MKKRNKRVETTTDKQPHAAELSDDLLETLAAGRYEDPYVSDPVLVTVDPD